MVEHKQARGRTTSGAALLEKACDVLEAVAARPDGIGHASLAELTGLTRTTLYRILATLTARGLLRQDPARRVYSLGFKLTEIAGQAGAVASANTELAIAAAPELRALRDLCGETSYLGILEGHMVVSLSRFEGGHQVRSAAQLGQRKPLHCTSQGKAILAFLPEKQRDALLRRMPLAAMTSNTLTERSRLVANLNIASARGFTTDDEEILMGVRCVGAPVIGPDGFVHGAISIAGPAWRMTQDRLALLGPEVAAAGRRIGAQLRPSTSSSQVFSPLSGQPAFVGICPRWRSGALWWSDALGPDIRLFSDDRERILKIWDRPIRTLVLRDDGDAIMVDSAGTFVTLNSVGEVTATVERPSCAGLQALKVRPNGEIWCAIGAPDQPTQIGRLTRDVFEIVHALSGDVQALAWSVDGERLFASVPAKGAIYELRMGRSAPLVMAELPPGGGRPLGLAADTADRLWVALADGWSVVRLNALGEIDKVLPLPVPRPLDLCFGGIDGRRLFVTTGREGVALDAVAAAPQSGRTFWVDLDIPGVIDEPVRRNALGP